MDNCTTPDGTNLWSAGQVVTPEDEDAPRILLIEDDDELAHHTCCALRDAGYNPCHVGDLRSAEAQMKTSFPALIVLDRMLPDGDGLSFFQSLQATGFTGPSLVLSALGETAQRVQGLHAGADDYLAKPFDISELVARVAALLRRSSSQPEPSVLNIADLHLDLIARTAARGDQEINLQAREFALLTYLARNTGNVVTKTMLLKHVWNLDFDPQTNVVEVHISRLRAKLDRGQDSKLLHTIRGNGYCLQA